MTPYDTEGPEFGELTHRHNDLGRLLASGLSWDGAAETIGVSKSTVARMMRTPGMRPLVDDWRGQNVAGILGSLIPEALASIRHLATVRDDPEAPDHLRVAAAKEILQSVARLGRPASLSEMTEEQAHALVKSEIKRIIDNPDDDPDDDGGGAS